MKSCSFFFRLESIEVAGYATHTCGESYSCYILGGTAEVACDTVRSSLCMVSKVFTM